MKRPAMWKVVTVGIALGSGVVGAGAAIAKPSASVARTSASVRAACLPDSRPGVPDRRD